MKRGVIAFAVALALGGLAIWQLHRVYTAEGSSILMDAGTAAWIRAPEESFLGTREVVPRTTTFSRRIWLPHAPTAATLHVRSFRRSLVSVNGVALEPEASEGTPWIAGESYRIGAALRAGDNLLVVAVESDRGPPALLVESTLAELRTDVGWETFPQGGTILGARLLTERLSNPIQQAFPAARDGLERVARYLLGAFALGVALALALTTRGMSRVSAFLTPSRIRWILIGGWVLLCVNNLTRLRLNLGFDVAGHIEFIRLIADHGRLPIATDGWQTFQSPLFYLIAAALYRLARLLVAAPQAAFVARLVPMACGIALIALAHRGARRMFPARPDLQIVAIVVAGTMPMSFYICEEIGNEPLAGAIGAWLLDLCLLEITASGRPFRTSRAALLGAVFGLALLAKITLLLLLPAVAWILWSRGRERGTGALLAAVASFVLASGLVSGWYFVRNWMRLGKPYMDGWDAARGIAWWQDPGYRLPSDLLRFGDALTRPIWSVFSGFWDGLYSTTWLDGTLSSETLVRTAPPWNFDFMVALAPMALPLTLAFFAGIVLIPATRERSTRIGLALLAAVWLCFLSAIAYVFLSLPIYSTVKGTYALSLVPAVGLLTARGFDWIASHRLGTVLLAGYLASWSLCVFSAFWVQR